jgi:flagellar biosynthetic protein FlhB
LLVGAGLLAAFAPALGSTLLQLTRAELLTIPHREWSVERTVALATSVLGHLQTVLLPTLVLLLLATLGITAGQVGIRVSFEKLTLDWSRLSISKGWERIFSLRSAMRGLVMLMKLAAVVLVTVWLMRINRDGLARIGREGLDAGVADSWWISLMLSLALAGAWLAISLLDYGFQWWQQERELKMSRQEVREEHKREEGDPQVKARMRRLQRENVKSHQLKRVPDATVVLTNPTHIAVAIRYERATMAAPVVIAKGTGLFARRIARVAREHGIPVMERKPLARALYAMVPVDREIPPALYQAIAEILAYIYRLRRSA